MQPFALINSLFSHYAINSVSFLFHRSKTKFLTNSVKTMKELSITQFFYPFILALVIMSCNSEPSPCFQDYTVHEPIELACDTIFTTPFLAGQTIPVGDVSVGLQENNLLVTFTTTGDWVMDESHVYVGDCGDIPLSGGCNPQFGQFPFSVDHVPPVQYYVYEIPLSSIDSCFCFIAHAAVRNLVTGEEETAIGDGDYDFPGNRWGWISTICLGDLTDCDPCDINEGDYRTQTQGGWGAAPSGNNPGTYLHNNFESAYPNGVSIGCDFTITLTSAQAVTDFLPQGGGPLVLSQNYIDPTQSDISTLAGNLLAAQLALDFDTYDPNFGAASGSIGDLLVAEGEFVGLTVSEILVIGNQALGGCPVNYTLSSINDALSAISNTFVDGTGYSGYLICQ